MEILEMRCPECDSSNTFAAKEKGKWFWNGVCRDCGHKSIIDNFYLTPMEKLYKRAGVSMFDNIINQ